MENPKYKLCYCDIEAWEEIVVKDDDYYPEKTVIYFHCDNCGEDFAVIDANTDEILYLQRFHLH